MATGARAADAPEFELAAGRGFVTLDVVELVAAGAVERTGVGVGCVVACEGALVLGFGAGVLAVGASGVGASGCDRLAREETADPLAGASPICGVASLRAPTGGSSGVGPDAAKAGAASDAASSAEHAATAIPPRRSVDRRDDVPVDIRPSLLR